LRGTLSPGLQRVNGQVGVLLADPPRSGRMNRFLDRQAAIDGTV